MDSCVTYLQITSAESGRALLLQLPPSLHIFHFSLYGCCLLQMQVWDLSFYIGGSLPPPCRAVGLPAAPPPGGRGLHAGAVGPLSGGRSIKL